jgi:hypothetical protein
MGIAEDVASIEAMKPSDRYARRLKVIANYFDSFKGEHSLAAWKTIYKLSRELEQDAYDMVFIRELEEKVEKLG